MAEWHQLSPDTQTVDGLVVPRGFLVPERSRWRSTGRQKSRPTPVALTSSPPANEFAMQWYNFISCIRSRHLSRHRLSSAMDRTSW